MPGPLDSLLDQFDRLPNLIWDAILLGVALVIGLILKFALTLLLRRKPKPGRVFSTTRSIIARLGRPFSWFLPLLALNFLLPLMKMKATLFPYINKTVEILLT